jgi:hypothetical protein
MNTLRKNASSCLEIGGIARLNARQAPFFRRFSLPKQVRQGSKFGRRISRLTALKFGLANRYCLGILSVSVQYRADDDAAPEQRQGLILQDQLPTPFGNMTGRLILR